MLTLEQEYIDKKDVLMVDCVLPSTNLVFRKNIHEYGDGCRCISECEKRIYKSLTIEQIMEEFKVLNFEGALVIDRVDILNEHPGLVISSPMFDTELKAGEIDKCPEPSDLMCMGLQGAYKGLANLRKSNPKYGGLDSIDIFSFKEWWREKGAHTGVIKEGKVIWDEPIVSDQ